MGKYFLISKTQGIPYQQYTGNAFRVRKAIPATVDEIVIGIKNKAGKVNKLTTFRDADGNILERCYDNAGKPFRNLVYSKYENIIGEDEYVESISRKEYVMQRKNDKHYKNGSDYILKAFWHKCKSKIYHISHNVNNAEKIISSSEVDYDGDFGTQIHCISEYPHLLKGKKYGKEKSLAYAVDGEGNSLIPNSYSMSEGVVYPQNDTYLPYRALDTEDLKLPITNRAIKDRGLADMNITVKPDYIPREDENNFQAMFNNWHGDILFNKFKGFISKISLVSTSYHEAEHAWQYYLDARLSKGGTPWADIIYFLFGPIKSKEQLKEAKAYKESIDNYVPYNGKNLQVYLKNFIEIKSNEAGEKAEAEYIKQGEVMRKNFSHIPSELL